MARLIDPVLADLQAEYAAAVRAGRRWHSQWVLITGYAAFFKVIVWCGSERVMERMNELTARNRHAVISALALCVATTALSTTVLTWMSLHDSGASGRADSFGLALYLAPQAFPLSITLGFALAAMWACGHGPRQQAPRGVVLALALAASLASFPIVAWVAPTANQAFRVSLAGGAISKGINELTLGELQRLLDTQKQQPLTSHPVRSLQWSYHRRWAIACAPLALAVLALTLVGRNWRSRLAFAFAGAAALLAYVSTAALIDDPEMPPFAAAWAPNFTLLALSVAMQARLLRPAP